MAAENCQRQPQMFHHAWRARCTMKSQGFFLHTYADFVPCANAICVICVHLRLPFAVLCGLLRFTSAQATMHSRTRAQSTSEVALR